MYQNNNSDGVSRSAKQPSPQRKLSNHPQKLNKIGIITKSNVKEKLAILKNVVAEIRRYNKKLFFDEHSAPLFNEKPHTKDQLLEQCDLVIVLGGDGTLLKTASHVGIKKTLILGINIGNVGFLTETTPQKFPEHFARVLEHQYRIDKRSLLRVTHYRNSTKIETFLALNEAVINQGAFARLIEMNIQINRKKVITFKADGLIMSSPTGSTGHALSAGGPIIHPSIPAIILTPICPASLSMRPIIIPNDRQVTITLTTRRPEIQEIGLTMDGQVFTPLQYGDKIKVRKSSRNFYLIRIKGNRNYYHLLRTKMHWGG